MDETWQGPESIWDMRRRAPLHFWAKANNARMSAYVLAHTAKDAAAAASSEIGYGGTPSVALHEGFQREASIAMEMILKASIAVMTKVPPPATHDVYELWPKAGLPRPDEDGLYFLALMAELLYWSGRYAAPISDRKLDQSKDRLKKHGRTEMMGKMRIRKAMPLGWDEFDPLYQMADQHFWELDPQNTPGIP